MTASVPFQNFINSTTNYYYDNNYQLTKSIYPNVAPFNAEISEWTYDDIGNRTQSILNGTPTAYTYFKNGTNPNNGQRLQSDGVNTYAYDLNGNNTSRNGSPGNYTFTWHKLNMMSGISGAATATYAYDNVGRRIQKKIGTTTYNYVYDGQNLIGQRTTGVQDFVFGPGIDEPLATKIGANIYYYSADGLGSVALLTDTNGNVQNSYVYDAWGGTRSQSGSLANPFTYTSRESNEAGMMYYRARYYNPAIGRFVSEDWIRFLGPNLYAYVTNSPTDSIDPSGLRVVNETHCTIYVKPGEGKNAVAVAPNGGTYDEDQDGIAIPSNPKDKVFKTTDLIDVVVYDDGKVLVVPSPITGDFGNLYAIIQAKRGGWKDLAWLAERHRGQDFTWDALFAASRLSPECCIGAK